MSSTTHCAKCLLESAGDTSANPQDGRAGATPLDTLCIGDLNGSIAKILCCGVTSTLTAIEPSMPRSNDGGSTPKSAPVELFNFFAGVTFDEQTDLLVVM